MNRLYRSKQDRIIAGVAGGIAEYFGVDAVLLRLLLVISVFFGGAGLFAYVIAWVIIPAAQSAYGEQLYAKQRKGILRPQASRTAAEEEAEVEAGIEAEADAVAQSENASASVPESSDGEAAQAAVAGKPCCAAGGGTRDVSVRQRRNAGMLLIGLGIILMADQFFGPIFHLLWPILLIVLGVCLLFYERREVGS